MTSCVEGGGGCRKSPIQIKAPQTEITLIAQRHILRNLFWLPDNFFIQIFDVVEETQFFSDHRAPSRGSKCSTSRCLRPCRFSKISIIYGYNLTKICRKLPFLPKQICALTLRRTYPALEIE